MPPIPPMIPMPKWALISLLVRERTTERRALPARSQGPSQPDLTVCRMNVSGRRDDLSILEFHYLVATPAGVEHFTEHHELALFTDAQYRAAFVKQGRASCRPSSPRAAAGSRSRRPGALARRAAGRAGGTRARTGAARP